MRLDFVRPHWEVVPTYATTSLHHSTTSCRRRLLGSQEVVAAGEASTSTGHERVYSTTTTRRFGEGVRVGRVRRRLSVSGEGVVGRGIRGVRGVNWGLLSEGTGLLGKGVGLWLLLLLLLVREHAWLRWTCCWPRKGIGERRIGGSLRCWEGVGWRFECELIWRLYRILHGLLNVHTRVIVHLLLLLKRWSCYEGVDFERVRGLVEWGLSRRPCCDRFDQKRIAWSLISSGSSYWSRRRSCLFDQEWIIGRCLKRRSLSWWLWRGVLGWSILRLDYERVILKRCWSWIFKEWIVLEKLWAIIYKKRVCWGLNILSCLIWRGCYWARWIRWFLCVWYWRLNYKRVYLGSSLICHYRRGLFRSFFQDPRAHLLRVFCLLISCLVLWIFFPFGWRSASNTLTYEGEDGTLVRHRLLLFLFLFLHLHNFRWFLFSFFILWRLWYFNFRQYERWGLDLSRLEV